MCRMAAEPSFLTSSGGVRSSPDGVSNGVSLCRSSRDAQSQPAFESANSFCAASSFVGTESNPVSRVK